MFAPSSKGTLPFMAVRLLDEWLGAAHGDGRFTHTAIDDLESFLWILFWVPLEVQHIQFKEDLHPESGWRKSLNLAGLDVQAGKDSLVLKLKDDSQLGIKLGYIKLFADLIVQWHSIALDGRLQVRKGLLPGQAPVQLDVDFYKKYYQRYLDAGFKYLRSLPDTWDAEEPGNQ